MIYTAENFDFSKIVSHETLKSRSKKDTMPIVDIVSAFDIETTRLPELDESVMYVWQWDFEGIGTVIGRKWIEFVVFRDKLVKALEEIDSRIIVWVHNLSYEFQYFTGIYNFNSDEVFCLKSRSILKCTMCKRIEFRCSYKQTNMSLGAFLKKMDVSDQKLTYDYSKQRFAWTPLTEEELLYCMHDVTGLVQAMRKRMDASGDTLATVPLTSTGYVRRDARSVLYWWSKNHRHLFPDINQYLLMREAFRGGNTHANRYVADSKLEHVLSYDRSSSYPDVLVNCKYPISKFVPIYTKDIAKVENRISKGMAVIFAVKITGLKLKDKYYPVPYISLSKCRNYSKVAKDNGRVLSAAVLETTITDIDYSIIKNQYEYDSIDVLDGYMSRYGYLPSAFRELICKYYKEKTDLKTGDQYQYFLRKCLLNSLYGMTAQDPAKDDIIFDDNFFVLNPDTSKELQIAEYDERGFLPYQWGVYTTAWARLRLEEGIRLVHDNGGTVVYCDTDSVKYIGDISWDDYNDKRKSDSEKSGAFADDARGIRHYMGVYEQEETYKEFKTLGAKKYAFTYEGDNSTYVTIAGVVKKAGADEITRAGGIDAFKQGFVFTDAGGLEAIYNTHEVKEIEVEGNPVYITNNVCLRPSTYTVGLTYDYEELIRNIKKRG